MVFGWINSGLKYVERSEKPDSDQIYSNMQHDISVLTRIYTSVY